MSLHEYKSMEQGSEEWHAARRGIVTASAIGKLVTPKTIKVCSNDYSRALTAQLVAERITGYTDPTYINDDMMRGMEDEPRARDKYSEHFAPARETGFMVRTEPTWTLGFSPDGLVGDDGLIEVKSRRQKKHLTTILADAVPLENMAQCQAGLLVSGREWIDYISYSGGLPMYVKRVLPDLKWFDALIEAAEQYELVAAEMIAVYTDRIVGLPTTERILEMSL